MNKSQYTSKNQSDDHFNFDKSKLFSLHFVEDNISFDDVKTRADQYNLPILCSYTTFPIARDESVNSGFQVMFLNDILINRELYMFY